MVEPPMDALLTKVDNKYTLCMVAGKRARQLIDGAHRLTNNPSKNAITTAINEINEDMITYIRTKDGIK